MIMKTVLHIVEAFGGGVVTYLCDLTRGQVAMGYRVVVAYGRRKETPEGFRELFDRRVEWVEVRNFRREIGWHDVRAFREVRAIAGMVKPGIVHTHSSKAGVIGRMALAGRGMSLFYTPHGYAFLMRSASPLKRFAYRAIERLVAAASGSTTIACSRGEYEEARKLGAHATFVNNGVSPVELDKYQPPEGYN